MTQLTFSSVFIASSISGWSGCFSNIKCLADRCLLLYSGLTQGQGHTVRQLEGKFTLLNFLTLEVMLATGDQMSDYIVLFIQFDMHLSPSVALRGGISLHSLAADDDDIIVEETEKGKNAFALWSKSEIHVARTPEKWK